MERTDPRMDSPQDGSYTVLCTYLPNRGKVELLGAHWPALRRHGFVTAELPLVFAGEDASGPFFVEILTWADSAAPSRAYWCEEINTIWSQFYQHSEPRGSRPAIEYPRVDRVAGPTASRPSPEREATPDAADREPLDWDRLYRTGLDRQAWDYDHASPELVAFLGSGLVPAGGRVLDLGCGSGREAIFLANCGYRTYGLDISEEALEMARMRSHKEGQTVSWHCGDARALPFPDNLFDFVNDRGCFHHLPHSERDRYALEVARVLRSGGFLLLRGSSEPRVPFVPVTSETVARSFREPIFAVGPVLPLPLVTNSGAIPGNLVVVRRLVGIEAS